MADTLRKNLDAYLAAAGVAAPNEAVMTAFASFVREERRRFARAVAFKLLGDNHVHQDWARNCNSCKQQAVNAIAAAEQEDQ